MFDKPALKPVAWLCSLAQEDGSVKTMIVERDPDGIRFNDNGEPSPFKTEPLFAKSDLRAFAVEICNEVMTRRVRATEAINAGFEGSTGNAARYPNALDALVKALL